MRKFLTLFLALGTILSATNFFPLGQGNRWTLQAENGAKLSVPVQLRLASRGAEPLRLRFIDGQRYDFVLRNERGEAVWRWSDGKVFIQAASEERVTDKSWSEVLEMTVPGPGEYRLEGRLTTVGDPIVAAAVTIRVY
jgi:hypothetical protein